MTKQTAIVWFRQDLRLEDNPALDAALKTGYDIIPLYIWSPEEEGKWIPGAASRWWLHYSLLDLHEQLSKYGLKLIIREGKALEQLQDVIQSGHVSCIFWNRRYEPSIVIRDRQIKSALRSTGLQAESYKANLLFEPHEISNKQGRPFQVFTPFWKSCLLHNKIEYSLMIRNDIKVSTPKIPSLEIESLNLLPKIHWDQGLKSSWKPGSSHAKEILSTFISHGLQHYPQERDYPSHQGVSHLSPYLHFGEISPRSIWHTIRNIKKDELEEGKIAYLRQLGWREFAHHLLYHFPKTVDHPLHSKYASFPWRNDPAGLKAWQKGLTGYPIVDAGMRELWTTGWMHNRVRMIVGSFLVKDLLISWQEGAQWFWDTLVDADLANNTLGWQWVGGCGADAAPYFRIFNPVTQGEKWDGNGDYILRWIPELAKMPAQWIHKPWEAPVEILEKAEIKLGKTYPKPIVDHNEARLKALEALNGLKYLEDKE